jgi:DNA-binding transcriptional LysR family regulator
LDFCVYAGKDYWREHLALALQEQAWIALDDSHSAHRTLDWLEKFKPLGEVGYRTSSFGCIRQACADGLGLAMLPTFLGDACSALVRVGAPWRHAHPNCGC